MVISPALDHASGLRIWSDGVVGLSNAHRGGHALRSSIAPIELQSRRRISRLEVVGCSNFPTGGVPHGQGIGLKRAPGFGSSLPTIRQPVCLRRVQASNKPENSTEEFVSGSEKKEKKSVDNKETFVEKVEAELGRQFGGALWFKVEAELGRQFGGALWFGVLLLCLALFGGGYVFLIVNYADFSDIPILRGPPR